jgi:prepilin-type N-terminal cleavage/methylation domain-containing protein
MKTPYPSAFSLTELLIAIALLGLVAAILIPRFLNIQAQAQDAVAQQMASQLNTVYANWKAAGGVVTFPATTSDILYVLTSSASSKVTQSGIDVVSDGGNSQSVRTSLPPDVNISISPTAPTTPALATVQAGPYSIKYDSQSDSFAVNDSNSGAPAIAVSGDLAFGKQGLGRNGGSVTRTFTITNTGTAPLKVSSVSYSDPQYTGSWSGTIAPSNSQNVTVTYYSTGGTCNGIVTVVSNAASGANTMPVSGTGMGGPVF